MTSLLLQLTLLLASSESLLLLISCWGLYCYDFTAMTSLLLPKLKLPDVAGSTAVTGFPTFTCFLMLASLLLLASPLLLVLLLTPYWHNVFQEADKHNGKKEVDGHNTDNSKHQASRRQLDITAPRRQICTSRRKQVDTTTFTRQLSIKDINRAERYDTKQKV